MEKKEKSFESNSWLNFLRKMWDVSIHPSSFFERIKEEKGLLRPFLYHLLLNVLFGGAWSVYYYIWKYTLKYPEQMSQLGDHLYIKGVLIFLPLSLGGVFIGAGFTYWLVKLFGGKGSYEDAFKLNVYAHTPRSLLGWISPLIFGVWSLVLLVKGLKITYHFSTLRALCLLLVGVAVGVVLGALVGFLVIYPLLT